MAISLSLIAALAALVVLWHCVCAINVMTSDTDHGLRLAIIAMACGAFAELAGIVAGSLPDIPETLLLVGFVAMIYTNRRRTSCPCLVIPDRRSPDKQNVA